MNADFPAWQLSALRAALSSATHDEDTGATQQPHAAPSILNTLVQQGLDHLPQPAGGDTLWRWQALAAVAEHDLSLAKLYEGHTDALAILAALNPHRAAQTGQTWGMWAAEAPGSRVLIEPCNGQAGVDEVVLTGAKAWCSGADFVSWGLLTAWFADGRGPQLVRVKMRQPGVRVNAANWHAVGMAGSTSLDVAFDGATATCVGAIGDYLSRPGFWQGGAGVAACWYGGSRALASALHEALLRAPAAQRSPFRLAALGRMDLALASTAQLLHSAAAWIDAHPLDDASAVATRVRLAAERCASEVLEVAGRALGAAPFCRDARFARLAADLPVFVRQVHGEHDLVTLGQHSLNAAPDPWAL